MTTNRRTLLRFGEFELDTGQGRLRNVESGEGIPLTPRLVDTLLLLIERRGELVPKRVLLQSVWPDVVVEENNATQAISELRRVLGERPRECRYIATVHGRGYRFVAEVAVVPAAANEERKAQPAAESKVDSPESVRDATQSSDAAWTDPPSAASANAGPEIHSAEVSAGSQAVAAAVRSPPPACRRVAKLGIGITAVFALVATHLAWKESGNPIVVDQATNAIDGETPPGASAARVDRKSIAVLPFENLSSAQENGEFFADGIHTGVLVQLAKVGDLKVISRTSVLGYRGTTKNLRQIGRELGVGTILEGGVQRAGDAVRINVQLIDAESDEHMWAEAYDVALSAEGLLAIQTDISTSIARSLQATLSPQELARLSEMPTTNTLAYDYYLSGNEIMFRPESLHEEASLASQMYERAVEADPSFAFAWANLSLAHTRLHWLGVEPTPSRVQRALDAAERAFALEPGLPEAHRAMGYHFLWTARGFNEALREFARAESGMPGDPLVRVGQAAVYEQLGRWQEAASSFERAVALDPRNVLTLIVQSEFYIGRREYEQAERILNRILEIAPDHFEAHEIKAGIAVRRDGRVDALKRLVRHPPRLASVGDIQAVRFEVAHLERDFDAQLQMLRDRQVVLRGQWQPALAYGRLYGLSGRRELAVRQYRLALTQLRPIVDAAPDNANLWNLLAEALAGVGERDAATEAARRAIDLAPPSRGVRESQYVLLNAVLVLAMAGDHNAAFEALEKYLSGPGFWSIEGLAILPRLEPLHADRRFERLVQRYGRTSSSL